MNPSRPTVSVIIPTFNRVRWLPEAVSSALGQSHAPLEVLIVDDGSTDGTEALCRTFGSPVRYLRQANAGVAAARNRGAREARGEFLAFLDSDDVWRPEKLSVQLAAHGAIPQAGWSMTDFHVILPNGEQRSHGEGFPGGFPVFSDLGVAPEELFGRSMRRRLVEIGGVEHTTFAGDVFELLFHGNFVQPTGFVVRREVMEATSGFDESLKVASDTEFFHRLAAVSPGLILMSRLYAWRMGHEECLTTNSNTARLIETGLLSLERAALLRTPLSKAATEAYRLSRQRLAMKLAYARLSDLDGRAARTEIRRAWLAGHLPSWRGIGIYLASLLPRGALHALGSLKRRARTAA